MDPFKTWLLEEVKHLRQRGWSPGDSPREAKLLERWAKVRPQMMERLRKIDPRAPRLLAFVLDARRFEMRQALLDQGMPPTDAEEEATREWLMWEPEAEEPPLRPRVPTSISQILMG